MLLISERPPNFFVSRKDAMMLFVITEKGEERKKEGEERKQRGFASIINEHNRNEIKLK